MSDEMYLAFPSAVKSYKDGNVDEALAWIEKIDGNPAVSMVGLALKFKIAYEDYDNLQAMNIADEMYKLGCKISNENLVWKMEQYLLWYEWYKAKICLHKDLKRIVSHMKSDLTHFCNEHPDNADAAKMPLFLELARSIDHFSSEDLDFILLENRENRRKVLYDAAKKKLEENYENASVIERLDLLYKCIGEAGNESGVIEQYRGRILEMCIDMLLDDANDLEPKELLILFKEFNIGYDVRNNEKQ